MARGRSRQISWTLVVLVGTVALGYLATFVGAVDPYQQEIEREIYLTSSHQTGLVFYHGGSTNSTSSYQSGFKIYENVTLTITGSGVDFKLKLMDRNTSWEGRTSANVTKLSLPVNGSSIWILVELGTGNATEIFNFGISQVVSQPVIVQVVQPEITVTVAELLEREWRAIAGGAVLTLTLIICSYLIVSTYRRGKILVK